MVGCVVRAAHAASVVVANRRPAPARTPSRCLYSPHPDERSEFQAAIVRSIWLGSRAPPFWAALSEVGVGFREPWYVAPGSPSKASLNLFYLTVRYSLPGAPPVQQTGR